ncbi:hypothetical protein vBVhaSVHB1_97 [Vibrio phage vB_VhaS-VHB1]|nr:hypothetical protein vBVhaSVHB1_97 [Vibrio phage vB_VhaS-VHB1]
MNRHAFNDITRKQWSIAEAANMVVCAVTGSNGTGFVVRADKHLQDARRRYGNDEVARARKKVNSAITELQSLRRAIKKECYSNTYFGAMQAELRAALTLVDQVVKQLKALTLKMESPAYV